MRRRTSMLFAWTLLVARPAAAELALEWRAPRECPQVEEVRAGITELVGMDLDDPAIGVEAAVQVERVSPSTLRATISIRTGGSSRERVLHDARCSVLPRAASVVVALAVTPKSKVSAQDRTVASGGAEQRGSFDETSAVEVPANPPASAASSSLATAGASAPAPSATVNVVDDAKLEEAVEEHRPVAVDVAPADRDSVVSSRNSRPRVSTDWTSYLGAGGAIVSGVLPGVAPAVVITGGVELDHRWRFSVHGTYAPPQGATLGALGGVGGIVGLFAAAADAGVGFHFSSLEVPLYAGFETGAFDATGQAVSTSQRLRPLWLGAYVGTGAVFSWNEWLATSLGIEGLAALRQPRFAVQSSTGEQFVFHRPGAIAARGLLELEVTLK